MKIEEILLVEDEPFQREILLKLLERLTLARVRTAAHGGEALSLLDDGAAPQLVISDLNMPEMDGIELMHHLALRRFEGAVIVLSAVAEDVLDSVRRMTSSYGIHHVSVLPKPVLPEVLATELDRCQESLQQVENLRQPRPVQPLPALQKLDSALGQGQFVPYFQPQIDARSQKVVAVEALVRWLHPVRGVLAPGAFLPQMTEQGLLPQLTHQMLAQTLAACGRWQRQGLSYRVSVNVSPNDLVSYHFADHVLALLNEQGLSPSCLTLEVTETEIYPNQCEVLEACSRLRMHGVGLAIDDFGTGHSSLRQLVTSPFTELKIDQCFVRDMQRNEKNRLVVQVALQLAKSLKLCSVAEGVETQAQADLLELMGCELLQGFVYAPAMAEQDFLCWAAQQNEQAVGDGFYWAARSLRALGSTQVAWERECISS